MGGDHSGMMRLIAEVRLHTAHGSETVEDEGKRLTFPVYQIFLGKFVGFD